MFHRRQWIIVMVSFRSFRKIMTLAHYSRAHCNSRSAGSGLFYELVVAWQEKTIGEANSSITKTNDHKKGLCLSTSKKLHIYIPVYFRITSSYSLPSYWQHKELFMATNRLWSKHI